MPNSIQRAIETARTVLTGHNALAEAAGYTGAQEINLTINEEGDGAGKVRELLRSIVTEASSKLIIPENLDNSRDENGNYDANAMRKWATRIYTLRALLSLVRSDTSFEKEATFNTRNFYESDGGLFLDRDIRQVLLKDTMCTFQYRVEESDIYPLVISWAILVDGAPVSKGTRQPIQRFVTSVFKPMQATDVLESTEMQALIRGLADTIPTKKSWYFYLSNQHTAEHYQQFQAFNNTQSCMSYDNDFYNWTGEGQHPMQCYDNSPDWNLLLISSYSPEAMQAMLDAAQEDESKFDYPFATRCMVLPKSKLIVGKRTHALRNRHFVFGKIYGHDQIVSYFAQQNHNTPLMQQLSSINGGRIPAIRSTNPELLHHFMLPYFDKENYAYLQRDGDDFWWISGSTELVDRIANEFPETSIIGLARASYQEGTASFKYMRVQHSGQWESANSNAIIEGVLPTGIEYGSVISNNYLKVTLDEVPTLIPRELVLPWAGTNYLMTECAWSTYHQALMPIAILENDEEMVLSPRFGWVRDTTLTRMVVTC